MKHLGSESKNIAQNRKIFV